MQNILVWSKEATFNLHQQKHMLQEYTKDLLGTATTEMHGVESSRLWSSSDKQSLLCGGSVLSSESTSSACNNKNTRGLLSVNEV